jgi:hypothetical protein
MPTVKPSSDNATDEITGTGYVLNGSGVDASWKAVNTYDDTKYVALSTTDTRRIACGMSGAIDNSVDPTTLFINIRVRKTGTPSVGSFLQLTIFSDTPTADKYFRPALNIDLPALSASFTDVSVSAAAWLDSGAGNAPPEVWATYVNAGGAGGVDVAYISFGAAETSSVDYPVPGGASLALSGGSVITQGFVPDVLGTSLALSGGLIPGTDLSFPGAPPVTHAGQNSYFFMPPGSTVGIIDDGNPYQGMGVDGGPNGVNRPLNP